MRTFPPFPAVAALGAAVLVAPFAVPSAQAEKVGVAAAVKPEATSRPPGGEVATLRIGKSVVYNERIDTSGSGQVQVLLLDGSTFTVGPGSSLVIDKFVYDPASGKGALVATFSKGALRFVGGKLSKDAPGVVVKTPAGALTVRGGIFSAKVGGANSALFGFIFGDSLTLKRGGKLYSTRLAGNVIAVASGGVAVRPQTAADVNLLQAALNGKSWKKTAVKVKGKPYPKYYGIQPTGPYPDQPFIREWYYDGAATQLLLQGAKPVPPPQPPQPPTYPNYPNVLVDQTFRPN